MSEPIGSFINDDLASTGDGKSGPVTDFKPIGGNAGPIAEPEILYGFDAIEPTFSKIGAGAGDNLGAGATDTGEPRRRRGRKPGSANAPKAETSNSLVDLTEILLHAHMTAAALLNIQELELDKTEAKQLSDAIKEVCKHYPVAFDPKKVAIANLLIVAGGIYGTRVMAYRMTRKKEPKPGGPQKVAEFPGPAKQTVNAPPPPAPGGTVWGATSPSDLWPVPPTDNAQF